MGVFGLTTVLKEVAELGEKVDLKNEGTNLPKQFDRVLIIDFQTFIGSLLIITSNALKKASAITYLDNTKYLTRELERFVTKLEEAKIKPFWFIRGIHRQMSLENRGKRIKTQFGKLKAIERFFDYLEDNDETFDGWEKLPTLGCIKKHFVQHLK